MKRVALVGTRGVPAKYGGFETFADEFARFNNNNLLRLTIYCERNDKAPLDFYDSSLEYLPILKSDNQLRYYWMSLIRAVKKHDVILITGPGGGFFIPVIKCFYPKTKFVVNPDGLEFARTKWSAPVRIFLWLISWASVIFADLLVADSVGIANYYSSRLPFLKKKFKVIEYGSTLFDFVNSYNSDYYLLVARMVPENNFKLIVQGFIGSNSKKRLLIVSDLPKSKYQLELLEITQNHERIQFIGPIYDQKKLELLRCNAFAHFHGHSVGGTNPSLLEAMSAGASIIAHDNVYNREVLGDCGLFFKNTDDIIFLISALELKDVKWYKEIALNNRTRIAQYYNWDRIFTEYSYVLTS